MILLGCLDRKEEYGKIIKKKEDVMFDIFLVSAIILAWFSLLSIVWQLIVFEYIVVKNLIVLVHSAFILPRHSSFQF